jgi:hypothetical protein
MANEAKPANTKGAPEHGAVGEVLGQAQQVLSTVTDQAKEQVATRLEHQKHFVSDSLESISGALRKTATQLRDDDQPAAPEVLDGVAVRVEQLADYLRGRSVGDLTTDAEQFARRNPAVIIGGAFVAGMLVTRFLKLSGRKARMGTAATPSRQARRRTVESGSGRKTGTSGV